MDERIRFGRLLAAGLLSLVCLLGLSVASEAGVLPKTGDARYELAFWESIKDSKRPEDYEAYLEAFPKGRFAPLAKARAAYLRKNLPAASTPPPSPKILEMEAEYRVIKDANLRRGPSASSDIVGRLSRGSRVRITGQVVDRNWYRIATAKGVSGFIYGELIQKPSSSPAPKRAAPEPKKQIAATRPVPAPSAPSPATVLGQLAAFKDCPECPQMVALPAGSFVMGDKQGDGTERPAHSVSIARPFAIGKYEVTVGQWNECVKVGACEYTPEKAGNDPDMPVRDLSWADAQQYVAWLSEQTGETYRLPTEAEWEYAARGGTRTRYWWGDGFVAGKVHCKNCGGQWDRKTPSRVGSSESNPFGLYDMNGGVWEWVSDCWHKNYRGAPKDGSTWDMKNCRSRVLRGGSWRNDSSYMHSASRFKYDADVRYLVNGFRVAKTIK